ncbi:MAG: PKD domain-containing protein [Opitutales bacterium]
MNPLFALPNVLFSRTLWTVALTTLLLNSALPAITYNESGGILIMEAEDTPSDLGEWILEDDSLSPLAGQATGSGYLVFDGNTYPTGPVNSPLEYRFRINTAGNYRLYIRIGKENHTVGPEYRTDVSNDFFVKMEGDYDSGPDVHSNENRDAARAYLNRFEKFYGGSAGRFVWTGQAPLEGHNGNHQHPIYSFKAGEYYSLFVAGRSRDAKMDRILLVHESVDLASAQNTALEASTTTDDGGATNRIVYNALSDFTVDNSSTTYIADEGALMVDANSPTGTESASLSFGGPSGVYDVSIVAERENGGQSTYTFSVNGSPVGSEQSGSVNKRYAHETDQHTFNSVNLTTGDTLSVESNIAGNASGRWRELLLVQRENAVGGLAPTAYAGPDQSVSLPISAVTFDAVANDPDGSIATYTWTQTSGPAATLNGESTSQLSLTNLVAGQYTFDLTVTDIDGIAVTDSVSLEVFLDPSEVGQIESLTAVDNNSNPIPGIDPIIPGQLNIIPPSLLTDRFLMLRANMTPGGNHDSVQFVMSGPQTSVSTDNGEAYQTASTMYLHSTGSETIAYPDGEYFMRALPYEGNNATDSPGIPFIATFWVSDSGVQADAGDEQRILLSESTSTTLDASKSWTTNEIITYTWSYARGPGGVSIDDTSALDPVVSGLTEGYHVFKLEVSDGTQTATDEVAVLAFNDSGFYAMVTDFALQNGNNRNEIDAFTPLVDGSVIDIAEIRNSGVTNLDILTNTFPKYDFGSVDSVLTKDGETIWPADGSDYFSHNNYNPFSMRGTERSTGGLFTPGEYTLTSIPHDRNNGNGTAGVSRTISFTVIDSENPTGPQFGDVLVKEYEASDDLLKRWHKITIELVGPEADEIGTPNPFADYRYDVVFTDPDGTTFRVPGHFAADGDAANTSATSGNIWHAHFSPNKVGTWTYTIEFYEGVNVAAADISTLSGFTQVSDLHGLNGSINIVDTDKSGRDFRGKGRLNYTGMRHLQFEGTGEYFYKVGTDSPENLLAYDDIDDTPNNPFGSFAFSRKTWTAHQADYDTALTADTSVSISDYTWDNGDGTELLGALYYLSEIEGLNGMSMILFNVDGDDDNVFPHRLRGTVEGYEQLNVENQEGENEGRWADLTSGPYHDRFDVSKTAQWAKIIEYAQAKGLYIDFKLQETENDNKLDGGILGTERTLYYRELISRFGYNLALNWNIGEESDQYRGGNELDDDNMNAVRSFTRYFEDNDPYQHLQVIHSYPDRGNHLSVYNPLIGPLVENADPELETGSYIGGTSLQTSHHEFHQSYQYAKYWVDASVESSKPWVVMSDEPGYWQLAVVPDAYTDEDLVNATITEPIDNNGDLARDRAASINSHINARRNSLWGSLMAGGAGTNLYYGWLFEQSDLTADDFRSRNIFWDYARYVLEFLETHQIPFWEMTNPEDIGNLRNNMPFENIRVLKKESEVYLVQIVNAFLENPSIDLSGDTLENSYDVYWYDPRTGGALQQTAISSVQGGSSNPVDLGPPPVLNTDNTEDNDWLILLLPSTTPVIPTFDGFSLVDMDTGTSVAGYDPLTPGQTVILEDLPTNLGVRGNTSTPELFDHMRFRYDDLITDSIPQLNLGRDSDGSNNFQRAFTIQPGGPSRFLISLYDVNEAHLEDVSIEFYTISSPTPEQHDESTAFEIANWDPRAYAAADGGSTVNARNGFYAKWNYTPVSGAGFYQIDFVVRNPGGGQVLSQGVFINQDSQIERPIAVLIPILKIKEP